MQKNRPLHYLRNLIVFIGLVICLPSDSNAQNDRPVGSCKYAGPLTFGILPFVSAEQLVTRFSPLANYLSSELHTTVRIETAANFSVFSHRTNQDKRYDILFTAPHFYPGAHSTAGYRLIAGVDSPGMWAVIVAPKQSDIYKLEDLRGKRLATVHPAGLATLLVKKHLADAGIDPETDVTMISTPSHNASLLSSYHGVTDASALMQPPYVAASTRVKSSMRLIARTQSTPHIPISVSPRINDDCANEIATVLLQMKFSKKGQQALRHNSFSGFKKATAQDYEKMKALLP